jgi:thymidylate synthase (FAD)
MDVRLLAATDDPEEVICRAARNDYMSAFNPELSLAETMEGVDGDGMAEKKATLIGHLMDHSR